MNCCKLVNLLAVLSAGTLHAESAFAAEAPGWEKEVVQQANQQKNVVTGTVLDENGFSVPGASVMVVGTTDGTVTAIWMESIHFRYRGRRLSCVFLLSA